MNENEWGGSENETYGQKGFDRESGGRVRGRPRLILMDDVKNTLGSRGMTMETPRQLLKDRKDRGDYVNK